MLDAIFLILKYSKESKKIYETSINIIIDNVIIILIEIVYWIFYF